MPACADELPVDASPESIRIECEIPFKYRRDVMMAEMIGGAIRMHDAAAWLTTDALKEVGAFDDLDGKGKGWLTLDNGSSIEVRYFLEQDGQTRAFSSATMDTVTMKAVDARRLSPPQSMTEREQRLLRAKSLVLSRDDIGLCTRHPPNTVVMEFEEDGAREILVFVMSAWVDKDTAPLGGYHMYRASEDGGTVIDNFSQTKVCMSANARELESGSLVLTHINSAAPTMFHVFMNLQYRTPIFVSTTQNGLLWKVDRGRISLMDKASLDDQSPTVPGDNGSTP